MSTLRSKIRYLILASTIIAAVFLLLGCSNGTQQVNQTNSAEVTSFSEVNDVELDTPVPEASGHEPGIPPENIDRALFLLVDFHGREYHKWEGHADYYPTRRAPTPDNFVYGNPIQGSPVPESVVLPDLCLYTATTNVNCRVSDYSESSVTAILMQGEGAPLLYINPTFTHGKFELPDNSQCWIPLDLMDGPADPFTMCKVYVVDAPVPDGTGTDDSNPPVCSPGLDEASCTAAGGTWVSGGAAPGSGYCACG